MRTPVVSRNMDSFVTRLLLLLLVAFVVILMSSSADMDSHGREAKLESVDVHRPASERRRYHRRRLRKSPEDAIRRQVERVREKILSQLSFGVSTAPPAAGRRDGRMTAPLPLPLLHLYDVDVAARRAETTIVDSETSQQSIGVTHDVEYQSNYKEARLIVFGRESK